MLFFVRHKSPHIPFASSDLLRRPMCIDRCHDLLSTNRLASWHTPTTCPITSASCGSRVVLLRLAVSKWRTIRTFFFDVTSARQPPVKPPGSLRMVRKMRQQKHQRMSVPTTKRLVQQIERDSLVWAVPNRKCSQ